MTYIIKAFIGDLTPYLERIEKYHRFHRVMGNWVGMKYEYPNTIIEFKTQQELDNFIGEFEKIEITERQIIIIK